MSSFFFCHYVFKKRSAAKASESVYMRERINVHTQVIEKTPFIAYRDIAKILLKAV